MAGSPVLVSADDLTEVAVAVLVAAGADERDAAIAARVMVWADRRGRGPQGTIWLGALVDRLLAGSVASPARIETVADRGGMVVLDAHGCLGQVAGQRAVDLARSRAAANGIALVSVRNSNHFGPCGFYAAELARAGLIGIALTNAFPKVAPHGAKSAVLGTNPLAFSTPVAGREELIGDLSTGAVAGSRVRDAIAAGQQLDGEFALDQEGRPTAEPQALDRGGVMLPMAGPKGTGLGLLVELLTSVLSGGAAPDEMGSMFDPSRPAGTSHAVLAIAADADVAAAAAHLADLVTSASPREGMEVRLPGDAGHAAARRERIELDPATVDRLIDVVATVGLPAVGWLGRGR